jgi:hypothetical protein
MTQKPHNPNPIDKVSKTKNPIWKDRVFYNNLSNDYASNGRIDT